MSTRSADRLRAREERQEKKAPRDTVSGVVLRAQSGFFWVQTAGGIIECKLRGRLKRERQSTDIAVIGDDVAITIVGPGEGAIELVLPRRSRLARKAAGTRDAEDVMVANLNQVLLVFACAQPSFSPRMLDRYLVICEHSELDPIIVATKADLVSPEEARAMLAPYERVGYRVIYASTHTGQGIDEARDCLAGRISVVTGKSGVGKSSLLNAVVPGLNLATSSVSGLIGKGRHTTTVAELHPLSLASGGYVADTPGIREIGLWNLPPEDLAWCYPEMRPFLGECYYAGCTHIHEPDCAVRAAVASGQIDPVRYDSYARLRAGDQ
ncbi:ribosome small subunit-dependent GTPase A [Oscillochloris sp. ZM17-4]|uniref:ribosome small subunit-dependent GTPase A n=1 Tax=Oscillochloris sp. ZM17-4 TaxID=2866714 RepID=UPI001C73DED1|nr:ribosome small subunit-dependent GTPase A [Oscillochloris sp. ZM17-4]MBX0330646.1 ribosome small subunit-dependent GTPase A [Oscillochloris sp. ZM17-4]